MMNGTNVSNQVLERLSEELPELTPEARKAATYVLENPLDVGVSTIREIAEAAQVKPNTLVRMAQQVGFDGYEDFRDPFREAIRRGTVDFQDRARWLQSIRKSGDLGELYADMVHSTLKNIEDSFAGITAEDFRAAAADVWRGHTIYTLGVGVNHANAQNFSYLASTGMVRFHAIPRPGRTAIDDLAWATENDVLIAITCKPYRSEVIEAVHAARDQGLTSIALSNSPASPIVRAADHAFVVSCDTPQFFPSSVSILAVLETLLSFVIASASDEVVDRVERFHARRRHYGLYDEENV